MIKYHNKVKMVPRITFYLEIEVGAVRGLVEEPLERSLKGKDWKRRMRMETCDSSDGVDVKFFFSFSRGDVYIAF